MDFSFSDDQQQIRGLVEKLCANFDDNYWLKKDFESTFPEDFY